jgi:hypothetical protein
MKTRNGLPPTPLRNWKGKKEGKEKNISLAEFLSVNTMRECARLFHVRLLFTLRKHRKNLSNADDVGGVVVKSHENFVLC